MAPPTMRYSAFAYFNADFTRGELGLSEMWCSYHPEARLSVAFSNHKFVHAVPKVLSGKRYSLPVWFTVKSARAMQV